MDESLTNRQTEMTVENKKVIIVEDSETDEDENITSTICENENSVIVEAEESDKFIVKRMKEKSIYKKYFETGCSSLLKLLIAFNFLFILSVSGFDFQLATW